MKKQLKFQISQESRYQFQKMKSVSFSILMKRWLRFRQFVYFSRTFLIEICCLGKTWYFTVFPIRSKSGQPQENLSQIKFRKSQLAFHQSRSINWTTSRELVQDKSSVTHEDRSWRRRVVELITLQVRLTATPQERR